VIAEILHKADTGHRVDLLPGNHDEFPGPICGRVFAGIEIVAKQSMNGRRQRCSCCHGDKFAACSVCAKWLAHLGDTAYCFTLVSTDRLHALRAGWACRIGSASPPIQKKGQERGRVVSRFEEVGRPRGNAQEVDGVICGHIHHAEIRRIGPILYLNDGRLG